LRIASSHINIYSLSIYVRPQLCDLRFLNIHPGCHDRDFVVGVLRTCAAGGRCSATMLFAIEVPGTSG
jgi:hypothetical protein